MAVEGWGCPSRTSGKALPAHGVGAPAEATGVFHQGISQVLKMCPWQQQKGLFEKNKMKRRRGKQGQLLEDSGGGGLCTPTSRPARCAAFLAHAGLTGLRGQPATTGPRLPRPLSAGGTRRVLAPSRGLWQSLGDTGAQGGQGSPWRGGSPTRLRTALPTLSGAWRGLSFQSTERSKAGAQVTCKP